MQRGGEEGGILVVQIIYACLRSVIMYAKTTGHCSPDSSMFNIEGTRTNFSMYLSSRLFFFWFLLVTEGLFIGLIYLQKVWDEIFELRFFQKWVSPRPQSIPLGLLRIFTKICWDIHNFVFFTGVNNTSYKLCHWCQQNWQQIVAGVVATGFYWFHDTGNLLIAGNNDTCDN